MKQTKVYDRHVKSIFAAMAICYPGLAAAQTLPQISASPQGTVQVAQNNAGNSGGVPSSNSDVQNAYTRLAVRPPKTAAWPGPLRPLHYKGRGPCIQNNCLERFEESTGPQYAAHAPAWERPLKYIPILPQDDVYLSFNGSERLFYVHDNQTTTPAPTTNVNEMEFRTNLGAEMNLGDHLRIYADLWNAAYIGAQSNPGAPTQNNLTTENSFVELYDNLGTVKFGVRAGIQQIWLGEGLIVSYPDIATIPPTFDGLRGYIDTGNARLDVFALETYAAEQGILAGHPNPKTELWGGYGSYDLPRSIQPAGLTSSVDLYYLGYKADHVSYDDQALSNPRSRAPFGTFLVADDQRNTFGVRYYGKFGNFDFDDTAEAQYGHFGKYNVSAWMFATNTGYTFAGLPLAPRLGVHFDGTSGGADHQGNNIHTYQSMYNSAPYYAYNLFLTPSNLVDFGPHLIVKPWPRATLDFGDTWYWRQNQDDAIYQTLYAGAGPNFYGRTANVRGSYIGNQQSVYGTYGLSPNVLITSIVARTTVGRALKAIGGKTSVFVVFSTVLRF